MEKKLPSRAIVAQHLRYDPETGNLIRLKKTGRLAKVGDVAGSFDAYGYVVVGMLGRKYKAHRLIWLLVTGNWPKIDIDHRDRDPSNNRWNNLREARDDQNQANVKVRTDNKSGHKGVFYDVRKGKYQVTISIKGQQHHLGYRDTVERAAALYRSEALKHRGEFEADYPG